MLAYNEVLPKKLILVDGEPYEVVSAWVFRKQQRKPVNQTRLRTLKTGSISEVTFHQPNTEVQTLWFEGEMIQVRLPIKMDLKVKEAPPDVRGNTAQGGSKVVTLETSAAINVPMFIKSGDIIRVNTETGQYVERV